MNVSTGVRHTYWLPNVQKVRDLLSLREISRHLEQHLAETKGNISPHFRDRNEISLNSEMSPAGKRTFARQRTVLY